MAKGRAHGATIFEEEGKRGNQPMPAPHFVQPDTGVASDIGLRLTPELNLKGLRVKSENLTTDLNSGIRLGEED
jgi:hypothetical protein